ncbi:hypothetical protein C8R47DRAFT_523841 [Mycena vitilis]|nr:hypothetical protein C8R47DRAFT_523841 [Mycena vitilis]
MGIIKVIMDSSTLLTPTNSHSRFTTIKTVKVAVHLRRIITCRRRSHISPSPQWSLRPLNSCLSKPTRLPRSLGPKHTPIIRGTLVPIHRMRDRRCKVDHLRRRHTHSQLDTSPRCRIRLVANLQILHIRSRSNPILNIWINAYPNVHLSLENDLRLQTRGTRAIHTPSTLSGRPLYRSRQCHPRTHHHHPRSPNYDRRGPLKASRPPRSLRIGR